MAKGRFNGGQVNSGFVLPDSNALKGLMENIDYNRKQGLLNVKAQKDYNSQVNKDFQDNQLKVKSGILFQDELNKATQDWVDRGADYRARGLNPFNPNINNPDEVQAANEFLKQKSVLEGMADTRDIYQKEFLSAQDQYAKGNIDEDSWAALNKFYKENKLSDLYQGGVMPPGLMKQFDQQAFLKGIAAPTIKTNEIVDNVETTRVGANRGAIRMNVENAIKGNPQAQRAFNKQFKVNPEESPIKMVMGTLDPVEIDATIDQYFKSPEGAAEIVKEFPSGVVPSYNSEQYNKLKKAAIDRQLGVEQRYQNGISSLAQQKENEVNQSNIQKYNFALEDQQMQRSSKAQQDMRFGWAAENQQNTRKERKFKSDNLNKRDQLIQGLQVGNTDDVMTLRQLAKSKGGKVSFDDAGNMIVEYKVGTGVQTRPEKQIINLSETNADGYVQLNEVLSNLTGKKVDIESLQAREPYTGGLVDVGDASATKDQVKFLRDSFGKDYKGLGDFLFKKGGFKSRGEAYRSASQLLDPKGKVHIPK